MMYHDTSFDALAAIHIALEQAYVELFKKNGGGVDVRLVKVVD